jgi:hypothetical protein
MIIEKIDPSRESFSDFSVDGTILTVADQTINLADEEGDQQVIISFGSCEGKVHRGLMPCCEHALDVVIPPRKYESVEVTDQPEGEAQSGKSKGKGAELSATHTETVPVPLDMESVTLKLWPVEETQAEQEEKNGAE